MPLDLFKKTKLPDTVPPKLVPIIDTLRSASCQSDCLRQAYEILSRRFHGLHLVTYLKIAKAFEKDIEALWKQEGYMHCTNINFLLRFLLVKSGWFQDEDIEIKWTNYIFLSPHQFTIVNADGKKINIDIWAKNFGILYRDHLHGFHTRT